MIRIFCAASYRKNAFWASVLHVINAEITIPLLATMPNLLHFPALILSLPIDGRELGLFTLGLILGMDFVVITRSAVVYLGYCA